MGSSVSKRLLGACAVVLIGAVLAGCNGSTTMLDPVEETTTTTIAAATTTVAPTTSTTTMPTTTTTVAPTTTTTLTPSEDPDHPFYDPYAGMDEPQRFWPGGYGEFDDAIYMIAAAAGGGRTMHRGCDTAPMESACYEVEIHTHADDKYHVAVISINEYLRDRDHRHTYIEVRAEVPADGWYVTKEASTPLGPATRPAWAWDR